MRKALFAALLTGVVVIIVAGGTVWYLLQASLPMLDGEAGVAGVDAPVTIERDDHGIPRITATSRADLAFATGYVHAQDRYFQMDLIRRQAAGELSELFGERAITADKRFRFHRFRSRARQVLERLSPAERELVERYAQGVNAGLAGLGARPFEYLLLRATPAPWLPEDSFLVVYAMYMQLNDGRAIRDVRRGLARRVLPEEVYRWVYPQGTPWDAPLMGEPRPAAPIPSASVYSLRDKPADASPSAEEGRYPLRGSNNWVVNGALSGTGQALVSNDMHLGLNTPNIYYQAHLVVDGDDARQVAGVSLPGTPFIVAGSNFNVAWGYTNSYGDWSDAVLLVAGEEPGTYRTPEGDRAFERHEETITVKDGDPVTLEIRETLWGPVLEDVDYPDGEIAVSWIAHKPEGVNLRIIELEGARSLEKALDIANSMAIPPQNFVSGDAEGNIAWTIAGKIPLKTGFDAWLPADWSREHGWQGWLPADRYPRVVNPDSGRIWTANARVADAEALRLIGDGGYDLGARARQIRDNLAERKTFTPEDMLDIQTDDRALFLAPWRELLLEVLDEDTTSRDPKLADYRQLAETWIPRASPDSVGYRLVRAFRLEVEKRLFHAIMTPAREAYGDDVELRRSNQFEAALWSLVSDQPLHMLPAGFDNWQDFLVDSVRENVRHLSTYGDSLAKRTWGEINTATIRHPLSSAIPVIGDRLNMPLEGLSGDLDMPRAQGPSFGASERFSVLVGDEANSLMHMPTGQSGHPLSAYYDKGHRDWVAGKPSPFLPGEAAHTLTLVPDNR
ncbi:MAG: penicillin acylase family protein [Woeseiaceae bacterium]|nr:penicillin acylase family protein [Woeseiaceae bacterium]